MGDQDDDLVQNTESSLSLIPIIPSPNCLLPPSYPPRSLAQDFMQKLYAFLNIKQLIRKADLGDEVEKNENKEKALQLALDNNFVTSLTSLVVVRPDENPTVSSLQQPHIDLEGIFAHSLQPSANIRQQISSFNPGHIVTSNRLASSNLVLRSKISTGNRLPAPIITYTTTYRPTTTTTTTIYRPTTTTTYGLPAGAFDAFFY